MLSLVTNPPATPLLFLVLLSQSMGLQIHVNAIYEDFEKPKLMVKFIYYYYYIWLS
jgi:hypothetical protein